MYEKYEELLKKTGKTSYQVSKDTGIGQNTLSNWKTGRSKPKIEKIKKPTKANAYCVTSKPFWISGPKDPILINQTPAIADQNKPYAPNTTDPKGLFFLKSK